ncbi:MAG: ATP-binding cassette domain-containing protein [Pseudomonadota bacterium]|nr:ABC transporter [Alphaproteobacteria bacterium]MCS5596667.1 ATP-binding cassette domain-containing protein [Alphaproteobacteria bacterium]MEC7702413.1 ATP-binding cassette domain-containing protein [Pseudomonadota bacterium]MED5422217.1 ATP-binding cassette domain-containing protein [Pseudomonadota bacterium]MEE3322718.1 ATP-binding cassette domain-containing protein [Pseudomonadota bacterium]|tara:strand:+ start:2308 stop:3285 length:978 start_codon:yes stop_codon:yes gene_type:complete
MSIIRVENLSKHFDQYEKVGFLKKKKSLFEAVKNISFEIEAGESVAFIGPNGAGKSTTLKMLTGILYPNSGTAEVAGYTPWEERSKLAREIGVVFGQRSQLWSNLPVMDSYRLLGAMYGVEGKALDSRVAVLDDMLDLKGFMNQSARSLSLGQRMRCEIAASLLHSPKIIFLDEPTIGLDIESKIALRINLQRLAQEEKASIMLTSHDSGDIEEICQRVIMIDHGVIKQDAPLKTLREDFDRFKILTLHSDAQLDLATLPEGCSVEENSARKIQIKIDRNQASLRGVTAELLTQYNVQDFSVENMPLDALIQLLYVQSAESTVRE